MRHHFNPFFDPAVRFEPADPAVEEFHASLPGYRPTALYALPKLASSLGLRNIFIKDESQRLGLNAFKILGASWAIHRVLAKSETKHPTLASATDGSHGRAVAWAARLAGLKAVIYVPHHMPRARIEAIRGEGAEVVVVDGLYDDAVREADRNSKRNGWQVLSDFAYPGYTEIPAWVVDGYRTLFVEVEKQIAGLSPVPPDFVILQAGVGAMAAAAVAHFRERGSRDCPAVACVQPVASDGLLESVLSETGEPRETKGRQDSIMALLNCGMPSMTAWPVLRAGVTLFLSIEDHFAEDAVRRLYYPLDGDPKISAGETGAAGLAGLIALCTAPEFAEAKTRLGISRDRSALVIASEGPSNPATFERIVSGAAGDC